MSVVAPLFVLTALQHIVIWEMSQSCGAADAVNQEL